MKAGAAFLMLVTAVLPCAAVAQHTGSRIPGSRTAMVGMTGYDDTAQQTIGFGDKAIATTRSLASCMLEKSRPEVVRYLNNYAPEPMSKKADATLSICFDRVVHYGDLKFSDTLFQEALAEAAVRTGEAPVSADKVKFAVGTWMTSNVPHRVVQEMAACLVERDGATSTALVKSEPASTQEAAAFQTLMPLISPCLIRGTTLTSSRAGLRLALAAAVYYQNLSTPSVSAAVSEKK